MSLDARRVRTAIVGCGKVGRIHASCLSTLAESEFVAVCNRTMPKARMFAEEFSVNPYTDVAEMIVKEDVEAVVVCTPHPAHSSPTVRAAELGAHVLVEKPMAVSLRDCDAMIEAADSAGIKLGVVSQRRLYEPVERVKCAIRERRIGEPIIGVAMMFGWRGRRYYQADSWRGDWDTEGGGVLVNQAPHQLDLLQWFMGPIQELYGNWANLNHPYIEVDDTAIAVLRFRNGGLGSIIVSNSQKPALYSKIHVHGTNGATVGVQTTGGNTFIAGMSEIGTPPLNDVWTVPGEEQLLEKWQSQDRQRFKSIDATKHYHCRQDLDFLRAVLDDRDPLVTGREGRVTVEMFTAIYCAQQSRRPTKFPVPAQDNRCPR